MDRPRPAVIPLASVPVIPADRAPTRVRIGRIVTRRAHGSNLLLGAAWMDPGEETNTWSFADADETGEGDHWYGPVDETYFVVRGRLRLTWDEGELDIGPDDGVYLAPGWEYRLENVGDEPAFFIYSMSPSPE